MTNPNDKAAASGRTTVRIPTASGDEMEAWLYLPDGEGPFPALVMAHGIGAIKAGGLAPFAERFCREGFAAVVFDYRQWGGSAGQPREELSFPRQREDYETVIGWAAAQPGIDGRRIFAWGTSFAGMYIVELAAMDARLAGAIGQSPLVDGLAAARMVPPGRALRLLALAVQDRLGSLLGRPALYLPGAGAPGELAQPSRRAFTAQLFLAPAGAACRRHPLPHPARRGRARHDGAGRPGAACRRKNPPRRTASQSRRSLRRL
jgi:uncharacterized protein